MSRDTNRTHPLDVAKDDDLCVCGDPASAHGDGIVLEDGSQPFAACFECPCEEFRPCCSCGIGDAHSPDDHTTLTLPGLDGVSSAGVRDGSER